MSTAPTITDLATKLDAVLERDERWPRFLTIDLAADYCSLSVESVRRMIRSGKLKPLRPVKGRIVLDRIALDAVVTGSIQTPRTGRGMRK